METQRAQQILNGLHLHSGFPYEVEFLASEFEGNIRIEARASMISVETGLPQKGIVPEFCSEDVPFGTPDDDIKLAGLKALRKFMVHEADESLMHLNKRIVEPHPTA